MNITHKCVIDLLEANDILTDYIDNHTPTITYYFGRQGQLTFDTTCIPLWLAQISLQQFQLSDQLVKIQKKECEC